MLLSMLPVPESSWLLGPVCTPWRGSQPLAGPSTRVASEKPPAAAGACDPSWLLAGLRGVAAAAADASFPGLQSLPALGLPKLLGPEVVIEHSSRFPAAGEGGLTNRERLLLL